MNDFSLENGCLVRWERHSVLEEISYWILLIPILVMVGLAWRKGMMTTADVVDFLSHQNQFHLAFFAVVISFMTARMVLYRGFEVTFDRGRNELRRTRMMRLGLRWSERWRLTDIVSISAEPHGDASWGMSKLVVRFRNNDMFVAREGADTGSTLANVARVKAYLGLS